MILESARSLRVFLEEKKEPSLRTGRFSRGDHDGEGVSTVEDSAFEESLRPSQRVWQSIPSTRASECGLLLDDARWKVNHVRTQDLA